MASVWLEPIAHETLAYRSDPIKLRRPLIISEFRVAKPQFPLSHVEFMAKDLRIPGDELVLLEKVERIEASPNDCVIKLKEPVLTNFLVVKGEYRAFSLCLEAADATLPSGKVTLKPVSFI
jgi:hypothetical protein